MRGGRTVAESEGIGGSPRVRSYCRGRGRGAGAGGRGAGPAPAGPGSCREDAVTGAFPPTSVSSGTDGVDAADGAAIAPGGVSSATTIVGSACAGGSGALRSIDGLVFAPPSELRRSARPPPWRGPGRGTGRG